SGRGNASAERHAANSRQRGDDASAGSAIRTGLADSKRGAAHAKRNHNESCSRTRKSGDFTKFRTFDGAIRAGAITCPCVSQATSFVLEHTYDPFVSLESGRSREGSSC
ncbi:MAG: hypothetical protein WAW96_10205, partial [Alphaproteobacteria bacterium]